MRLATELPHGNNLPTGQEAPFDGNGWMALLYKELRDIASRQMRQERTGHTLQTTALVNEAWLRLAQARAPSWASRDEFCAAAARTIRRVLVDHARARNTHKRGGASARRVELDTATLIAPQRQIELTDLDAALTELERIEPRHSRVVELKFFCGLTDREVAAALGVSERTVRTDWTSSRLWLLRRLALPD